jgi:hypothetical protein
MKNLTRIFLVALIVEGDKVEENPETKTLVLNKFRILGF